MAISISNAYVQSFESNIRLLAQQGNTLLRQYVSEVHDESLMHNWDMLGSATARAKSSARMASPAGGDQTGGVGTSDQIAFTRRRTSVVSYDAGEQIEIEDPSKMMADPTSSITTALANAMKRKIDDVIISACNDPVTSGAGATVNFPSGQVVGGATSIISVDLLLSVQQLFMTNDVDPDEERVLVISPVQYRTLMNIDKLTSADYQALKGLATGYLPNFLGFHHVVISNRLGNTTTPPTAGQIYCLAFTRRAIGLHIAKDIWARVDPRVDMSYAWQFYTAMTMAATRVEDSHVVRIHLKDAQS
jgi:hypothetical protein